MFSAWYPAVVGLLAAQRLAELAISRRNESRVRGARAAAASYPLMVAAHAGLLTLPLLEVAAFRRRPRAPLLWLGLLAAAAGLRRWSISTLGESWNTRAVVPADLKPVVSGPYRWIRHPNYLAVVIEFVALPMAAGAWLSALGLSALNAAVLFDRIRAEERLLSAVPGYEDAFRGRSRLIPGIF